MTIRLYAEKHGEKQTFINITKDVAQGIDTFWFNIINENGATEDHPYGYTTRDRLEHLREELNVLLDSK